ncbi:hypothetical protein CPI00_27490, partial [Klebsiella pneumoniae subsp. pneumoniae]|nr:hypothetical protein [Klebsiella pneumoniae subsp. pneumoniae]
MSHRLEMPRACVERLEEAAGGLLKTAVRLGLQLSDIASEIQAWFPGEQQLALQRLRGKALALRRRRRRARALPRKRCRANCCSPGNHA